MQLREICQPIKKELRQVERLLGASLKCAKNKSILEISEYLLDAKGKRLRPALVILSARASQNPAPLNDNSIIPVATALELIHMASLIHDDVVDQATTRHHKPTINLKYGQDVSIALGDYLYSKAFELISSCGNLDILSCISCATRLMCEGELIQVCERDNLDLLKERYLLIVKKKTASLFAASCQAGGMVSRCPSPLKNALKQYGLNFGIAFQIVDDCLDLISDKQKTGKEVGCDFKMGELTLPILNLLSLDLIERDKLTAFLKNHNDKKSFYQIRERFLNSEAIKKTRDDVFFYMRKAKSGLNMLNDSRFKDSLMNLADYIVERVKIA